MGTEDSAPTDTPIAADGSAAPAAGPSSGIIGIDPRFVVVFDGPPGAEPGRFVECENAQGASVGVGEWAPYWKGGGLWALGPFVPAEAFQDLLNAATRALTGCPEPILDDYLTEVQGALSYRPCGRCPYCLLRIEVAKYG